MTTPTIEQLHTLADRAERARLAPAEAAVLRAGLAVLDAARRSAGGAQTALQAARAQTQRAEAERDSARRWAVALEQEAAGLTDTITGERRAAGHDKAALDEVRDTLAANGHRRAQVDDWPDVEPALIDLIAERDRYRDTLHEVLRHFTHHGHPGEPCLSSGWVSERTVTRWRTALNAPSDAATGPHSAPHTPSGPEGHASPERPTRARTDARTSTEA